jgi:deazaflavin-dependent oxidoreductase (nitroreductase family)
MTRSRKAATREYTATGPLRRLVRRSAPTRPMTWLYVRIQQRTDEALYRLSRGRTTASSLLTGLPVVMLTTTGARSGQQRTVPLLGIPYRDQIVVIASNYGRRHHPAWYHNLRANPAAELSVNRVTHAVEARELNGPERDACFQHAVAFYPGFLTYRDRATDRHVPLLVLEPR